MTDVCRPKYLQKQSNTLGVALVYFDCHSTVKTPMDVQAGRHYSALSNAHRTY